MKCTPAPPNPWGFLRYIPMTPADPSIPLGYLQLAKVSLSTVFGNRCYVASIEVHDELGNQWLVRLREACKPSIYLSATTHYTTLGRLPTYTLSIVQGNQGLTVPYATQEEFMQMLQTGDYGVFGGKVVRGIV